MCVMGQRLRIVTGAKTPGKGATEWHSRVSGAVSGTGVILLMEKSDSAYIICVVHKSQLR